MKIELYYFDDCPSYRKAWENLNKALRLEGLPEAIDMVRVASEADAQAKRFLGSPTIRIDGVDLEGTDAEAKGYGYGCRIYAEKGRSAGWPSVQKMRKALRVARCAKAEGSLDEAALELGEEDSLNCSVNQRQTV